MRQEGRAGPELAGLVVAPAPLPIAPPPVHVDIVN